MEPEDGWYVARALEDASVFTQGRTLDEVTENIREVADLLHGEKHLQVVLVIPPPVGVKGRSRKTAQTTRKR